MLSRTAENLYWIGRYLERAETAARLIDVGARISLLPASGRTSRNEWDSLLRASGSAGAYQRKYREPLPENVENFLFFDRDNPSSVVSCFERARENGRIVRTALTSLVWDALNTAFQEVRDLARAPRGSVGSGQLTEWTMRATALLRGAIDATQLRGDGYNFLGIGFALERADSTARLLDVKYFVLLPGVEFVGSGRDNFQWRMLLRAMSQHRAFQWAYGGTITAAKVAHFLILNPESPRSLRTATRDVAAHLGDLSRRYGRGGTASARADAMLAELSALTIDAIFEEGLHEFLTRYIAGAAELGGLIHAQYLTGGGK